MRNVIDHLRQDHFEQAELTLELLDFERLLLPIPELTEQGRRHFVDPAIGFGVERVHETGEHIRICRDAIARRIARQLLTKRKKRWRVGRRSQRRKGEPMGREFPAIPSAPTPVSGS